ncbi:MAG: TolC family protein [Muribaculaceae bacterium]
MNKQRVELLLAAVLLLPCAGRAQNTVSLEQLWALADEQVTSLKIERAAVESAEHDVAVNAAGRLPDISTELSVGYLGDGVLFNRDYTNSMHIDNPHFTNNFALRAQQTIYSGGAVSAGIDIAKLNREMAKLNYATNREEVRFVIASHYLDLCRMQNRMKVVEKNIALTQDILRNINSRYNNGTALKTDIMRYELQLEALQLNQIKLLDAKKTISHTLATLLHLNADTLLTADFGTVDGNRQLLYSEEQWQQLALNNNRAKQSQLAVDLSEKQLKLQRSELLPKVAAVAEMHLDGPITTEVPVLDKNIAYWFAGIGVSYNLSALYKSNRKVSKAKSQLVMNREAQNLTLETIKNAVHSTYIDYLTAYKELDTQRKSVELANANYLVVEKRYNNGLALLTDMLDASNTKLAAETGEADAEINIAYYQLKLKYLSHTL